MRAGHAYPRSLIAPSPHHTPRVPEANHLRTHNSASNVFAQRTEACNHTSEFAKPSQCSTTL
eukprot:14062305-Alexandrium_andersonii.AAC.1